MVQTSTPLPPSRLLAGDHFSKPPETFRARKAIAKSRTLRFIHIKRWREVPSYKKFQAYTLLRFNWYRWSKNGFTGPKTFRRFRETGPWRLCEQPRSPCEKTLLWKDFLHFYLSHCNSRQVYDPDCLPRVESMDLLSFLVLETSYYKKVFLQLSPLARQFLAFSLLSLFQATHSLKWNWTPIWRMRLVVMAICKFCHLSENAQ